MAYSNTLAERVRTVLGEDDEVGAVLTERKMFGGLTFMVAGHMAVGVMGDDLMVRFDAAQHDRVLGRAHTRPFDMQASRPAPRGWVLVEPDGTKALRSLRSWLALGCDYARSLPPK